MCDRYFIEFPPQEEPLTAEALLEESLTLVYAKDIHLHRAAFFMPFEPRPEKLHSNRVLWPRRQRRSGNDTNDILRHNIKFMIKKTKHFGLLMSQLTWVGLMNFAEKRRVLQQTDDDLRAAALYIIMMKKDTSGLTQFLNCLHMTGNHEIANIIEAKLELLAEIDGKCEYLDNCVGLEASCDDLQGHYVPSKKRKTSADSGFDDSDDDGEKDVKRVVDGNGNEAPCTNPKRRQFKCKIKPLDAVDVIAIINGKEDSRCKVELCKCGHYHQYPKWKELSSTGSTVESGSVTTKENVCKTKSVSSRAAGFSRYFTRNAKVEDSVSVQQEKRQGILSPAPQPVEVGADLNFGLSESLEFTKPRRSCSHLRLRFDSTNSFAEHPDTLSKQQVSSPGVTKNNGSLKSRLPRFFRIFV